MDEQVFTFDLSHSIKAPQSLQGALVAIQDFEAYLWAPADTAAYGSAKDRIPTRGFYERRYIKTASYYLEEMGASNNFLFAVPDHSFSWENVI